MQKFFLHLRDGSDILSDTDGYLVAGLDAAVVEAIASARWLMSDQLRAGHGATLDRQFEITDEVGQILATVRFWDALQSR